MADYDIIERDWEEEWIPLEGASVFDGNIWAQLIRAYQSIYYTVVSTLDTSILPLFDLSETPWPEPEDVLELDTNYQWMMSRALADLWFRLTIIIAGQPYTIDSTKYWWGEPGTEEDDPPGYLPLGDAFGLLFQDESILAFLFSDGDPPENIELIERWQYTIETIRQQIDSMIFLFTPTASDVQFTNVIYTEYKTAGIKGGPISVPIGISHIQWDYDMVALFHGSGWHPIGQGNIYAGADFSTITDWRDSPTRTHHTRTTYYFSGSWADSYYIRNLQKNWVDNTIYASLFSDGGDSDPSSKIYDWGSSHKTKSIQTWGTGGIAEVLDYTQTSCGNRESDTVYSDCTATIFATSSGLQKFKITIKGSSSSFADSYFIKIGSHTETISGLSNSTKTIEVYVNNEDEVNITATCSKKKGEAILYETIITKILGVLGSVYPMKWGGLYEPDLPIDTEGWDKRGIVSNDQVYYNYLAEYRFRPNFWNDVIAGIEASIPNQGKWPYTGGYWWDIGPGEYSPNPLKYYIRQRSSGSIKIDIVE